MTARAASYGYLTSIHLELPAKALGRTEQEREAVLLARIGSFVPFEGKIAEVRASTAADAAGLRKALTRALQPGASRDIMRDPAYGVDQLATIAWISVSMVQLLRDLLAHGASILSMKLEAADRRLEDGSVAVVVALFDLVAAV